MNENSPAVDRDELCLDQPDIAEDSAAGVPPALMLIGRIDIYRDDIVLSEFHHIGDIDLKACIAAEIVRHQAAVQIDGRMGRDALEVDHKTLVPIALFDPEGLSIPCVFVVEIAERVVEFLLRLLLYYEVMRKRDRLPVFKSHLAVFAVVLRSVAAKLALGLSAEVDDVLERRRSQMLVALLEFPA